MAPQNNPFRSANNMAKRKALFLEALVANNGSVSGALRATQIPKPTYNTWRARDPIFRAHVDSARGIAMSQQTASYEGTFISFRKAHFGFDTYFHQARIIQAIEECPPGGVTLVLVPPEFGKTTLLEDYCNYSIGRDPNIRITVCSEGQPHARKIMRRVQARCTDMTKAPTYIAKFGPFYDPGQEKKGKPWSADFFTVYKSDHDERDYTMEARGWRSAIAGTRTDLLYVDDIQSSRSMNLTDRMVEIFRQDWLTRPGKEGRTIVVGTRVGVGDFYETIQELGIVDRVIELPAVNEAGESLCPEMWPNDALAAKRRKVGESVWWRNYMQKPKRAGSATFTEEMTEGAKDIGRKLGQVRHSIGKVAGLDPSLVGANAIVVCGYSSNRLEILDARRDVGLGSVENILARVDWMATQHRFTDLLVEGNAFQRGLVYDERLRALGREHGFRVREHTTNVNKLDADIGVARMPSSFISGEISIPYEDEGSRAIMELLIEELHNWRPHVSGTRLRQDLVMALWFCWLHWTYQRPTLSGTATTIIRRTGLPWGPTALPGKVLTRA